jgi:hypothetical protein
LHYRQAVSALHPEALVEYHCDVLSVMAFRSILKQTPALR